MTWCARLGEWGKGLALETVVPNVSYMATDHWCASVRFLKSSYDPLSETPLLLWFTWSHCSWFQTAEFNLCTFWLCLGKSATVWGALWKITAYICLICGTYVLNSTIFTPATAMDTLSEAWCSLHLWWTYWILYCKHVTYVSQWCF